MEDVRENPILHKLGLAIFPAFKIIRIYPDFTFNAYLDRGLSV